LYGINKFEMVDLDACLMSTLEVYDRLATYAHYAVASEESEPGVGRAYIDFLQGLTDQPEMSSADLAGSLVEG
jgi:hypothetical protein